MIFEKNGVRYTVTDPAHIDCFRAKGWDEVTEPAEEAEPVEELEPDEEAGSNEDVEPVEDVKAPKSNKKK